MAQDKKQNDDDLLILSDESDNNDSIFNIGSSLNQENSVISNDDNSTILFDTTIEESPKIQEDSKSSDFTLSFDWIDETPSEEDNIAVANNINITNELPVKETTDSNNWFSFDLSSSKSSNTSSDDSESVSDILDWTISKFQKKADKVESDMVKVESDIKDLKDRVKQLEKEIGEKDEEKQRLTTEKLAIDKNIKNLEKMKNDSSSDDMKLS